MIKYGRSYWGFESIGNADASRAGIFSPHYYMFTFLQGLFSTLELVPMWSGVDHDVEMFASGIVTEDEGDWDAKEAAATANGGSAAGGAGGSSSGGEGAKWRCRERLGSFFQPK